MKKYLKRYWLLAIILVVASILRLWNLSKDPVSLFGDELDLGYQAYSILKTGKDYQGNFLPLHFHSLAEWRTPLYLYSAVPAIAAFGISPLGVRLPAAIFGILDVLVIYLFVYQLLEYAGKKTSNKAIALVAAALMAISPWSLQYSRAGFEVTEMLFLLIAGLWLFLVSLKTKRLLWLSVLSLVLTALVYSTAKLFTPLLLAFLFFVFRKEILKTPLKQLIFTIAAGLIVGIPIAYSTLFGGGAQRFNYISVFADPTMQSEVGSLRETQARIRGETGSGLSPSISDRLFYNKFTYWGKNIARNYLGAFSTNFLFIKGDPNLRQSIGIGEMYKIEAIFLIAGGLLFLFDKKINIKIKTFTGFLLFAGPIPASLTSDGGNHATRLILILPPLIFLVSFGIVGIYKILSRRWARIFVFITSALYLLSFIFYIHNYYYPYTWASERWWHYGWGPAISEVKSIQANYDRVIISMRGEPAWIFFAGYYEYPPSLWQKEFPIGNDVEVPGFGKISHTGKYYFGSPGPDVALYGLGKFIDAKTLYVANASEDGTNLIIDPSGTPAGLKLIKAIPYPSGEPAFYIFSGI